MVYMAMSLFFLRSSNEDNMVLLPRPLCIRESVRETLFALRFFDQVSLAKFSPLRQLAPASVEITLVEQVEQALKCQLPDEILACLANGDMTLGEEGFV